MREDLISRSELLEIEKLLWCDAYEGSKEARHLYDQMLYDIENMDGAMYIPKDFEVKGCKKSVIDALDMMVIWFDEDKWDVGTMAAWYKTIEVFFEKPLLLLPKSFSRLEYIPKKDLIRLKDKIDRVVEAIE